MTSQLHHFIVISVLLLLNTSSTFAKDSNILAYKDRGISYHPHYVKRGTIKYAKASWYGRPFHGRLTASGEHYNMYGMTAAHRTYALGTVLRVTSLKNWKSVIVRVNDRGPFYSSRAIDLSYGAAKKLGFVKKGIERIKIEVLSSKGKGRKSRKVNYSKQRVISKKERAKQNSLQRKEEVQVASFSTLKNAQKFKRLHHLKHTTIRKSYLKKKRRTLYRVIVNCTPWEAKSLLNSKKFSGAYKI